MSDQKAFRCHLSGWPRQFGQLLHLSVENVFHIFRPDKSLADPFQEMVLFEHD